MEIKVWNLESITVMKFSACTPYIILISPPIWNDIWVNNLDWWICTYTNHEFLFSIKVLQVSQLQVCMASCDRTQPYRKLLIYPRQTPVTEEFPMQRSVTRSFNVFFDLRLNKQLSKQSWGWWFAMPLHPLWQHCNVEWHFTMLLNSIILWKKYEKGMHQLELISTSQSFSKLLKKLRRSNSDEEFQWSWCQG